MRHAELYGISPDDSKESVGTLAETGVGGAVLPATATKEGELLSPMLLITLTPASNYQAGPIFPGAKQPSRL